MILLPETIPVSPGPASYTPRVTPLKAYNHCEQLSGDEDG